MSKYAVIKIQGHQYKVSEGDKILVDRVKNEPNAEVLLIASDTVKVGNPVVKGAKIEFKVIGDTKGDKIYVRKYKAKSRYRKKIGFRPQLTELQVTKIV